MTEPTKNADVSSPIECVVSFVKITGYIMKIFTHHYKVEIFNNGKFCWRNHGWIEKGINDYRKGQVFDFIIIMALALMVIFAN